MVPDTPHVEAVLFAEDGVASGLTAGKIVVDMSSISPIATKGFAKKINDLGCEYLDAPVSGGEVGSSEEHTSELQSLMRISYAVFCLKKKNKLNRNTSQTHSIYIPHV